MIQMIEVIFAITAIFLVLFMVLYVVKPTGMLNGLILDAGLGSLLLSLIFVLVETNYKPVILLVLIICTILGLFLLGGIYIIVLLLFWNSVRVLKREKRSLQNMLTLFLAIAICIQMILSIVFVQYLRTPAVITLFSFLYVVEFYLVATMMGFLTMSVVAVAVLDRPSKKVNYVVVLGCGLLDGTRVSPLLAGRINCAIHFYENAHRKGRNPKILLSGGQGNDEKRPEAQAMAEYAIEHGVAKEDILIEDQSLNTIQNLQFSKKIMEQDAGGKKFRCAIATSSYHVYRARIYAAQTGLKYARGLGARTAGYFLPNATLREYIAVMLMHKKFHFAVIGSVGGCYLLIILINLVLYL